MSVPAQSHGVFRPFPPPSPHPPFFFFNDTATTEIYTLSLHDALPIYQRRLAGHIPFQYFSGAQPARADANRSEEHTSELQSPDLVCRLLLEKKNSQQSRHSEGSPHRNGLRRRHRQVPPPATPRTPPSS